MEKNEEMNSFFAVNLSKMNYAASAEQYRSDFLKWQEKNGGSTEHLLLPLHGTGVAFGPFENEKNALSMAASSLTDGKDYFGDKWVILVGSATAQTEFYKPRINDSRLYVCSTADCGGIQRFKGSCSKCKSEGKELVPTIEIRDWDGRLG